MARTGSALRRLGYLGAAAALGVVVMLPPGAASAGDDFGFINFQLGGSPPAPVGTLCPGADPPALCTNGAAEPAIRADGDGSFYVSSENGVTSGTLAWKSTDGGAHYASLSSPNIVSRAANQNLSPAGGDTDLALATDRDETGLFNVYVASLELTSVAVSTSRDGGVTWSKNLTSATTPGDDREWIAADGASKVCISYHDLATSNINVDCSYDAGASFSQHALPGAIDAAHLFLINNNQIGNLAIDPSSHNVYQAFSGIATGSPEELACAATNGCYHAVWIGVSTDGGVHFTDYPVYVNPDIHVVYGHQFVNLSLDSAGNLYALFTDDHNLYLSTSADQGQTWSPPVQVNSTPSNTAIFPWGVAGDPGKFDVVWYGTSYYDGVTAPDNYPLSAAWYVYFAQNLDALTPGSSFRQVQASPVIHLGGVCEGGVTCTGNRDLYDDFGVAASPVTGMASIVFSDDQYDPAGPNRSTCTPARSNTGSCVHTRIATQTTGAGIYSGGGARLRGR